MHVFRAILFSHTILRHPTYAKEYQEIQVNFSEYPRGVLLPQPAQSIQCKADGLRVKLIYNTMAMASVAALSLPTRQESTTTKTMTPNQSLRGSLCLVFFVGSVSIGRILGAGWVQYASMPMPTI